MAVEFQGRIRELDGWRGVSVLMVILTHTFVFAFPVRAKVPLHELGVAGQLGVEIFFVISGFVITRLLILEERKAGRVSLKAFYTRRFFRIVPVFALVLSVVALLSWLRLTPTSWISILRAAFLVKDVNYTSADWFLGHTWSLAVEEQFYLTFPILFVFLAKQRRGPAFLATMAALVCWCVVSQWGMWDRVFSPTVIFGFCSINLGVLLALYEYQARSVTARVPGFLTLLAAMFVFFHPLPSSPIGNSIETVLVPPSLALVLMHTVSRPGWVTGLLNSAVLQWIGLVSYSTYLWQQLFDGPKGFYGSPSIAIAFEWLLPGVLLISGASYYWVERPSMRLGKRLSAGVIARQQATRPDETSQVQEPLESISPAR